MIHIEWQHGGSAYLIAGDTKDVRVYRKEISPAYPGKFVPLFDMAYDPARNRARRTVAHAPLPQDTYTMIFSMAREHLAREAQERIEKHKKDLAERQVAFAFAGGK